MLLRAHRRAGGERLPACRRPGFKSTEARHGDDAISLIEYERAGLGKSLKWGEHPAVLVVDFSLGFTDPSFSLGCDLSDEVAATGRLLAAARAIGAPVIFTTQIFDETHPGSALWRQKGSSLGELLPGSRWAELDPELSRQPDEPVIAKLGASALFETDGLSLLQDAGADTVLVCGATTSGCVRASVVDLLQSGLAPIVVTDCVGDRAASQHEASLVDMAAKYADLVTSDVALDYLRESAWAARSAGRA